VTSNTAAFFLRLPQPHAQDRKADMDQTSIVDNRIENLRSMERSRENNKCSKKIYRMISESLLNS